ncbi:hypothetical protein H6G36_25020 [Anabaena minutissima FACHB-250]|nr:hypothetical protein [Anabaena minutissima FACHB-250]
MLSNIKSNRYTARSLWAEFAVREKVDSFNSASAKRHAIANSTQHSALTTQHWLNAALPLTALSTQHSALTTQHSALFITLAIASKLWVGCETFAIGGRRHAD